MRLKYPDGSSRDARILTLAGNVMRVALRDGDDAVELSLINGTWFSEERRPVTFEFPWPL